MSPGQRREPGHPQRAKEPGGVLFQVPSRAHGDPHKGAEGNPGGPREEASPAARRAQPSALAAPLSGHRAGRGRERPSAPQKVSGEPFPPRRSAFPRRVCPERGPSRAGTSAGPRAGLPPRLSLLPTRPLSAGLASAAASPPLPPARARARAAAPPPAAASRLAPSSRRARPGPGPGSAPAPREDHGVGGRPRDALPPPARPEQPRVASPAGRVGPRRALLPPVLPAPPPRPPPPPPPGRPRRPRRAAARGRARTPSVGAMAREEDGDPERREAAARAGGDDDDDDDEEEEEEGLSDDEDGDRENRGGRQEEGEAAAAAAGRERSEDAPPPHAELPPATSRAAAAGDRSGRRPPGTPPGSLPCRAERMQPPDLEERERRRSCRRDLLLSQVCFLALVALLLWSLSSMRDHDGECSPLAPSGRCGSGGGAGRPGPGTPPAPGGGAREARTVCAGTGRG